MMRIILFAFLAYLLYVFIFRLVIPVYIASRKIKKGFREMQERMQQQQQGHYQAETTGPRNTKPDPGTKPRSGDYIEFEEIK